MAVYPVLTGMLHALSDKRCLGSCYNVHSHGNGKYVHLWYIACFNECDLIVREELRRKWK
jgi:hypothetical protein